jgi:glucose/arabinose dehydrogenase
MTRRQTLRNGVALLLASASAGCSGGTPPLAPPEAVEPVAREVASGLSMPLFLTAPPGDDRLFVVEQPGRIRVMRDGALRPQPFLDITDRVLSGGERGLLSTAFPPDYAATGHFWVFYTDLAGATVVERYRVSADADVADAASAMPVLRVEQPFSNHNGGLIAFGPDGMLYVGLGDGGSGGDPQNHGQRLDTLLGALLRIDVRGAAPYAVPTGNPFANTPGARPEIWAFGLRNPWRYAFDRVAGRLYIADVGQNRWEEINAVPASQVGVNYGWRLMEGSHCYPQEPCDTAGLTPPVHEYGHADGCSVTGGYVYRGSRMPALQGLYFYSDFCRGWLRSFRLQAGAATDHREWDVGALGQVLSFGEDAAGELYVLSANGRVYALEPR